MTGSVQLEVRLGAGSLEITEVEVPGLWRLQPARGLRRLVLPDASPQALPHWLDRLQAVQGSLPQQGRLCLGDDIVYPLVMKAGSQGPDSAVVARDQAMQQLRAMTGSEALQVEVLLLPGGRSWLACGVEINLLDATVDALEQRGCEVREIGVALLDDLQAVRSQLPNEVHCLALLRSRGVTLLGFDRGRLVAVEWEPLSAGAADTLFDRLKAYQCPLQAWPMAGAQAPPVGRTVAAGPVGSCCLLVDEESRRLELDTAARQAGWRLLPARVPSVQNWDVPQEPRQERASEVAR